MVPPCMAKVGQYAQHKHMLEFKVTSLPVVRGPNNTHTKRESK